MTDMGSKMEEGSFVLCIENRDCEDLERCKVYRVLKDEDAESEGYLRVVDESGEDYLYPRSYFVPVQIPRQALEALELAR